MTNQYSTRLPEILNAYMAQATTSVGSLDHTIREVDSHNFGAQVVELWATLATPLDTFKFAWALYLWVKLRLCLASLLSKRRQWEEFMRLLADMMEHIEQFRRGELRDVSVRYSLDNPHVDELYMSLARHSEGITSAYESLAAAHFSGSLMCSGSCSTNSCPAESCSTNSCSTNSCPAGSALDLLSYFVRMSNVMLDHFERPRPRPWYMKYVRRVVCVWADVSPSLGVVPNIM